MTPNRVVTVLAPVFAALAGWVAEWVANNFPGTPSLDRTQLTAVFIAGATYATAHVIHWMRGWQKDEARRRLAVASGSALTNVGGTTSAAASLTEPPPPEPAPLNVKPVPPAGESS